ncbi:iron complex outermembrane receptor protein/outer membrane receptor for ferrienterochelin and colicins [Chitinophaga polysaccharea]|uniref:Iron complex outermembrane receptor protein/outer membrane receptor for ferrienterochelin and colicins n=1 Tax=Chitinophaga polysaccharea TaxID=1293035 RepID=A0A561PT36_9BACT|nr:TonB-dependent receptor [Chitinophaga polysaccharea]TWF41280.1 iron complex outermembrane receptor protein/outer membrane receptor for ferrienterochelin and colicins [Chitinophaga polysaccharea]
MKRILLAAIVLSITGTIYAQNRVPVPVKDTLPAPSKDTISKVSDLGEVVISSTRNNSRIEDLPMKVEVLGKEEMIEESGIKPGNVASILGDLSVIHIQNTSAVSGNNAIRMQGLDGKYTQLLRDGMPVYEGLSGNFGVLAIPPLDLKQIEIIKGSVSTLYGGGAIAGIINFIAKTPGSKPELTILANRSTLKETNVNAFYSERYGKTGLTLFAGVTTQNPVDVNKDGFSDVPRVRQYLLHPRFFWYINPQSTLIAGYTGTIEKREGGDMQVLEHQANNIHQYTEVNNSNRHSVDLQFTRKNLGGGTLTVKGVGSFFHLQNDEGTFSLIGNQTSTYAEAAYNKKSGRHDWVVGLNNTGEIYRRAKGDSTLLNNYTYNTMGAFVQDGYHITNQFMAEAGLRADYHNVFGWYVLPRLAFVYKPIEDLSIRLSAGTGYKSPAVFTTQTQTIGYRNLLPLGADVKSEKSQGINFDGNYRTNIGKVEITLNQALYYTHIKNPILPVADDAKKMIRLENMPFAVNSLGTDTYLRMALDHLELYLGYNHTVSKYDNASATHVAFAPQDKFAGTLAYEIEEKWRFGIENAWVGNQYDYNNQKTPNYWFWAAMISRQFGEHITVVLNGENIFDARQGKNTPLYTGPVSNPTFAPLWGPIDGRTINLSVKFNL